jgi:hypothetical protein
MLATVQSKFHNVFEGFLLGLSRKQESYIIYNTVCSTAWVEP